MLDRVVRPLLRIALLSVLFGSVPPAPLVGATSHTPSAIMGPRIATASATAPAAPAAPPTSTPVPHPEPPPPSIPARAPIASTPALNLGKLPLAIVQNVGQTDPTVKFHARGLGGSLFFTSNELILRLPSSPGTRDIDTPGRARTAGTLPIVVRQRLLGANPNAPLTSIGRLPGVMNVLIGSDASKWRSNLATYAGLVYHDIYSGIDLHYGGSGAQIKSTYQIAPGADPNRIRWRYTGAFDTQIDSKGNLLVRLPAPGIAISTTATVSGTLIEEAPQAWQEIGGRRVMVDARYTLAANGIVGFALGSYDSRQPLTIDPTFNYSTYLGGNGDESGYGIAVDRTGKIYVTGSTNSDGFPTQDALFSGCGLNGNGVCSGDAFVTKLTADAQQLVYSTFVGGDSADIGWAIAVDSSGSAYITGETYSANFPITSATARQSTFGGGGGTDVFVTKLNPAGNQVLYSTYLGGANHDYGYGIAVNNSGKAYVTGAAVSAGFPITTNAYQLTHASGAYLDAFVAKLDTTASGTASLPYSTFIGGTGGDAGHAIAIDSSGNAYVTGYTFSSSVNGFPIQNAAQSLINGDGDPRNSSCPWYDPADCGVSDAFVAKLNPNASGSSSLIYSTFLGGSENENNRSVAIPSGGIAVDSSGNAYITGWTRSANFPPQNPAQSFGGGTCGTTPNTYPCPDAFVSKLNASGGALLYSTFLGGSGTESGRGLAVNSFGQATVTGWTQSTNFPTSGTSQTLQGTTDGFVTTMSATGGSRVTSRLVGGTDIDYGYAVALGAAGAVYITGQTYSSDFLPASPIQTTKHGYSDAFILRIGGAVLPDDQNRTPEKCPCASAQPSKGGPVNTRTGNLWTSVTDLAVQTPGVALGWTRIYNSQAISDTDNLLGYGWTHPFATRLITPTTEPGRAIVLSPKGNRLRFDDQGNNHDYTAWPGVYDTLVRVGAVYTQTLTNQQQYVFDAATGRLIRMRDPQGRRLTLTYSGTPARLTTVADAGDASRTLTLGYTSGRITSATALTRTVSYGYDANSDLVSVTDVRNQATTYRYRNHLLTQVTDPLNQIVESSGYNPYTVAGKVVTQTLQTGEQFAFSYLPSTTIITTTGRDGRQDVQYYDYAADNTLTGITTNNQAVYASVFDSAFNPGLTSDGNGHTTQTTYITTGLAIAQTNALNQSARVEYDGLGNPRFVTDTLGIATGYLYDQYNNVTRITAGITTSSALRSTTIYTYSYNVRYPGDSLLSDQRGPDGVVTHYDYPTSGSVTARGQISKSTIGYGTAIKQETTYAYDALGRVTSTTVAANNSSLARTDTNSYNTDNTIAKTIQNYKGTGVFNAALPDQNITTTYGYDKLGRTIAVTDTLGTVDVTRYNAKGQAEATARNIAKPWSRDSLGQPIIPGFSAATPDINIATQYGYDGLGRTVLITQTGILTGQVTLNAQQLPQFASTTTRVTKTDYDSLSRPVTTTLNYRPGLPVLADTNIALYTRYDGAGNVITQTDALGRWFVTQYDALNRPVKTIANYQDDNPLTGPRDADIVTATHYDAAGRVDQQTNNYVDGTFTATEPITDRVTLSAYDTLGRPTTTTLNASGTSDPALNRSSSTAYNAVTGRVTGQQDPLGRWVSQQYDLIGRVTKTIQNCVGGSPPASCTGSVTVDQNVPTQSAYDTLNRTTIMTDALGYSTRTSYDGLGRMLKSIRNYQDGVYSSSAPDTDVATTYRYDALGRTLAVTDTLSKATSSTVNALGQTVSTTDQLGRVTTMGYDSTGTLRWSKRLDGQLTLYQIDGLGRTITTIVNYKDGVVGASEPSDTDLTTRTVYDAAGRRIQTNVKTNATTERITQFAYDGLDRLIGVTENFQSSGCTIAPCNVATAYQYDRAGNRTAIIDPLNHVRKFTYTAADEQKKAIDALGYTSVYTYDQLGRVTNQDDPRASGYDLTMTYDGLDRLKTTAAGVSTNLATITNYYDALGRRTRLDDGTGSTLFSPDALGRITQVNAPNTGIINYTYDGRGLRTKLTYPTTGTVINYSYFDDGRLNLVTQGASSPVTQASYAYDPLGRLAQVANKDTTAPTSQLVTNYGYDGADRLRALRTSETNGTVAGFQYQTDRLGLRTAITETLPMTPTMSTTRLKTITFEAASLTDPVTGASSVNGTVQLTTTGALKGFYAAAVNTASSYLTQNIPNADDLYVSFYLRVNAAQATSAPLVQILNGATTVGVLQILNTGKLRLLNNTTQIGSDSPTALTVGTLYRIGLHQKKSTATNGVLEAFVVQGDQLFGTPFAWNTAQTFTTQATQLKIGAPTATKTTVTVDDIALDTVTLAPPSQNMLLRTAPSGRVSTAATEPAPWPSMETDAAAAPTPAISTTAALARFGNIPLSFIPNAGQHDAAVRYHTRGMGGTIFFTPQAVVLAVPTSVGEPPSDRRPGRSITATLAISMSVVRLNYLGANASPVLTATEQLPGTANYFIGNNAAKWRTNLPTYAGVVYQQLYPGIDARYDGVDGQLKSTYTIAPGSDPSQVRWRYQGAKDVQLDAAGNLLIVLDPPAGGRPSATTSYTVTEQAPIAWQMINGQQVAVDVRYSVAPSRAVSFALGAYDASQPLIIDPTLIYSTYLGGSNNDRGIGIAIDSAGNAYVAGFTYSANFPTQSPLQSSLNASSDAFVAKLAAAGNALLYSTYLGGNNSDIGTGIAVDSAGNAALTGYTQSTTFPTQNARQSSNGGGNDVFVSKLNATGSALLYSTYLGGTIGDYSGNIAVDGAGQLYITGSTSSTNFPTASPSQPSRNGVSWDAFVAKINPAASGVASLIYSTYLGGSADDWGNGIAVDSAGNAYIVGQTDSPTDFPTQNPRQPSSGGGRDAFVAKLIWNGTTLSYPYATYLGGNGTDAGYSVAIDSTGNVYLTGETASTNFPTQNALQSSYGGVGTCASISCPDAFVTKLDTTGSSLVYSTYLGGNSYEYGYSIAVDSAGHAFVTGATASTSFPIQTALQATFNGGTCNGGGGNYPCFDAFMTRLNTAAAGAASLVSSTYVGGSKDDIGYGIVVDSLGNAYITGETGSSDFPTANPKQASIGGGTCSTYPATNPCMDAFILKLNPSSRIKDITFEGGSLTDLATGVDSVSGAATLDTAATIKGVDAARIPNNTAYLEENFIGVEDVFLAFYIKLNALPSSDARLVMLSNGGTTVGNLVLRTNGKLGLRNGSTQIVPDSALALQANTLYRIGLHQKKGTGGNAVLEAFVVQGDNLFGTAFASMTNGTWTTNADRVRLGATNGNAVDLWLDDIGLDNAAMPLPTVPTGVRVLRYNYDGLQRLTGAVESSGTTFVYGYDLAGNRTSVQLNGGAPSITTYNSANQITNAGFTYDNAGNLTSDGIASSTYDALNRTTARGTTTYVYNGDGTLVSQASGGVTTRYTQDLAAPLSQVLQTQVGAAARTDYLYGLNRLASLQSGVKTWYAADALGSVRRTVADSGTPLGIVNYDPWGTPESGTVPTFGFTGEVQDVGAGLVNLRARWYSTTRARFTSVDPFAGDSELPYSQHQYQYGYSDPVLNSDPSGKCVPYPINPFNPECQFIGWNPTQWNWADGREYYYGTPGTIGKLALMALFPPAAFVYGSENAALSYIRYNENPTECNGVLVVVDTVLAVLPFTSLLKFGGGLGPMAGGGVQVLTAAHTQLLSLEVAAAAVGAGYIPNVFYSKRGRGSDPSGSDSGRGGTAPMVTTPGGRRIDPQHIDKIFGNQRHFADWELDMIIDDYDRFLIQDDGAGVYLLKDSAGKYDVVVTGTGDDGFIVTAYRNLTEGQLDKNIISGVWSE